MFEVAGDSLQHRVTVSTSLGERTLGFTNAIVDVNGTRGAVAVFRELNEVEAAQRRRHDQLRRQEFAASARTFAHEVKSPLTAISGAAQVIAREGCTNEQRVRLSRAIESEANRINQLVEEYVERRQAAHEQQTVDVGGLLSEVVEVNLLNAPERARVSISCEADLPTVRMDGAHLKQVVLNLLQNAIKATTTTDTIRLFARREKAGVLLIVTDTGCGIPEEALPLVFDEGYSTRTGGGLGLTIARDIVQSHAGVISVASVVGEGATFTVWLPC
jgi:signal transduction histidine kinase